MKKLLLLFVALIPAFLALLPTLPALAYSFEVNVNYYWENRDSTCSVIDGDIKYSGQVTIPAADTYNGISYSVTYIGNKAFYNYSGLTSVTIPFGDLNRL